MNEPFLGSATLDNRLRELKMMRHRFTYHEFIAFVEGTHVLVSVDRKPPAKGRLVYVRPPHFKLGTVLASRPNKQLA